MHFHVDLHWTVFAHIREGKGNIINKIQEHLLLGLVRFAENKQTKKKNDVERWAVDVHLLKVCDISGGGSKMATVAVAQQ